MMTKKHILIDDAVPYAKEIFGSLGKVTLMPGREIQRQHLKSVDALIIRSRTQITESLLKDTPVQFVGSTVVGLDHVDQDALKRLGIHFYSAQGCNANSVAEYVITAIFAVAEKKSIHLFPANKPMSLGIIGVGHVGKSLEQKAQALGWTVLRNDPPRAEKEGDKGFVDLETALQADIISVHTPLTKEGKYPTHHLINEQHLKKLQPHQILINAARGGIIDEKAWTEATTAANIIDCWENEPHINFSLYQKADIATPHIAGHSLEAKVAGSEMVYRQLCAFWSQPIHEAWRAHLPPQPHPIPFPKEGSLQDKLNQILQTAYPIWQDDHAIRAENIEGIIKAFEAYRRHYPIRREWPLHTIDAGTVEKNEENASLLTLLQGLGFSTLR